MKLFAACYLYFRTRRGWLLLMLLLLLAVAAWSLPRLRVEENISAMLPDGGSQVARDFQLLQQAPFARKLVIQLTAEERLQRADLLAATQRFREALPPQLFRNLFSGPGAFAYRPLMQELGAELPLLLETDDFAQLADRLRPEQIDQRLANLLAQLLQPQGMALKQQLQRDPLQFDLLALEKLRYLNPVPQVRLEQGYFLSPDGHSSLLLADTPVPLTDAAGARELFAAFNAAKRVLPEGIRANLISGHAYTLANASAIQGDMQRVLLVSAIGILLLFLLFLRSLRTLSVYLLPLLSMLVALLVTAACFEQLSGITIGFGAVLLGITIDFGLHVYFALRHGRGLASQEELLQAVSRPVLFGGLTTLAAFAVLLRSELPGQRQLAVFALAGIGAALLLALLVLPHFIGRRHDSSLALRRQLRRHLFDRSPGLRKAVLGVWLLVAGLAAWQAQNLSINGELKQLGYIPAELQRAERQLGETWGQMRGRALIFAQGERLESALQRNEKVWQLLRQFGVRDRSVSLAPLLPSRQTQQQRWQDWEEFWQLRRAQSQDLFQASGAQYGFSAAAFAPFWQRLEQQPAPLTPETLRGWGLERVLDGLLLESDKQVQLLTLLPDRPELIAKLQPEIDRLDGVTLVSQSRFGKQLSREIGADFSRFISSAGIAVLLLLILLYRRLQPVLLALLPVLTGLLVMFGSMSWLGLPLNLFNVVGSILIIGLGVDYGIFMVCHGQQAEDLASARAVLVSGLTTLVGFGSLVLAKHPALHSIGLTVLLGISAAVPTAVLVIPAFRPKRRGCSAGC